MNIPFVVRLVGAFAAAGCAPAAQTRAPTPTRPLPVSAAHPRAAPDDQREDNQDTDNQDARGNAVAALRLALPPPPRLRAANTCCELSQAQIEDSILSHPSPFLDCYAKHGGDKSGKIALAFSIATDGRVSAVKVVEDELERPKLTSCVLAAARSVSFPSAPLPTVAMYALRFKSIPV